MLYFTKRIEIIGMALIHANKSPYLHWCKKNVIVSYFVIFETDLKNAKLIIQIKKEMPV